MADCGVVPRKSPLTLFMVTAWLIASGPGCKRASDQAGDAAQNTAPARKAEAPAAAPLAEGKEAASQPTAKKSVKKKGLESGLKFPGPLEFDLAKERLLEQSLSLTLEIESPARARGGIYDLSQSYGYIHSSREKDWADQAGFLRYDLRVRRDRLYQFLQDLPKVGRITSENFSTHDHTAEYKKQEIRRQRNTERAARRFQLTKSGKAGQKNIVQLENSLERSENEADDARFRKWEIRDKVRWVRVSLNLKHPDFQRASRLDVPPFENLGVQILEGLLNLVYITILLLPFLALGAGAFFGLRRLWRLYRDWRGTGGSS